MLRSLYTATTGMLVQKTKMDVMTNNITNIETVGYKKDSMVSRSFQEMMLERINDPNGIGDTGMVGPVSTGIHIDEIITEFAQGSMEDTGRLSDVGLEGSGFFVVSTPDGERYTRNGAFAVNSDGYLVNQDGFFVQGEAGRIHVGNGEFSIDEQGFVSVDGAINNKLSIVSFADVSGLRKRGNNLFSNEGTQLVADTETKVQQGFLEGSNVDMAEEMVDMMGLSRTYETNQRIIKMLDDTLEKSVNEIGRV